MPSKRIVASFTAVLIAGVLGVMLIANSLKSGDARTEDKARGAAGRSGETIDRDSEHDEAVAARRLRARAAMLTDALIEEFPDLRVEWRDVPPEENGFFQLLEFASSVEYEECSQVARGIRSLLKEWDAEHARALLEEHSDWLAEAWRISALAQTSGNIPGERMGGFMISATAVATPEHLLLLDARLAIDEGRADDALAALRASRALARHLQDLEAYTPMSDTIRMLGSLARMEMIHREILPKFSNEAPVADLRELISFSDFDLKFSFRKAKIRDEHQESHAANPDGPGVDGVGGEGVR